MEDIESPRDLLSESDTEEWKASCAELHDLEGVNSEVLRWVMGFRLDHDFAQLRKGGLLEPKEVDPQDPYEIANCQFWYGTGGLEMIEVMKMSHKLFQGTRNKFYKLGGRWAKWQFWKDHLQKHCEDFMVEDSDLDKKVLDGKVWKAMKLYRDNLGIPALDNLFVLDLDPTAVNTSGEDEDEAVIDIVFDQIIMVITTEWFGKIIVINHAPARGQKLLAQLDFGPILHYFAPINCGIPTQDLKKPQITISSCNYPSNQHKTWANHPVSPKLGVSYPAMQSPNLHGTQQSHDVCLTINHGTHMSI